MVKKKKKQSERTTLNGILEFIKLQTGVALNFGHEKMGTGCLPIQVCHAHCHLPAFAQVIMSPWDSLPIPSSESYASFLSPLSTFKPYLGPQWPIPWHSATEKTDMLLYQHHEEERLFPPLGQCDELAWYQFLSPIGSTYKGKSLYCLEIPP